ncbi:polysaccharide deacetylase [Thermodesulfovibrio aggregans]|uniref:Polysaccharide deacetylase n=1 Tax=Thermodesulfovibrio aggregans TaxID=86166 RepID=A0A0U9HQ58_9BACT|nr:polysaccharide deacetylase family protein [Thermodesulfovibrio aggregans]GAQ94585.1 polysaccharide deacetylase [Thermodesulfovibrio aggregans]
MLNNSIPVVMYHHVMPGKTELNITPELFEEQLLALNRSGWKPLDAKEFLYLMEHPEESRKKCVLLTFDDGFVDNYLYAYPLLKKYKMKALMFVATDFIADLDIKRDSFKALTHKEMWRLAFSERKHEVMCTWNELRQMQYEGIFDIQSHGHTHKIPDFIKNANYVAVEDDLRMGKELLIKNLGKEPLHLAWPKGVYDTKAVEIAKKLGFKALYTTQRGANVYDLNKVKRLPIKCKGASWLIPKLRIYSSSFFSKIYLKVRTHW